MSTTMGASVFTEQQRFRVKVFWYVLIPAMILSYGVTLPGLWGDDWQGALMAVAIMTAIFVPIILGVLLGVLHTRIDQEGVHYKYAPFQRKYRTIKWTEMKRVYVKQYDAFGDYGGWGIRWGADGWLYNMQGNMGLMIHKTKGTDILLGTQKPEEMERIMLEHVPEGIPTAKKSFNTIQ